MKYIIFLVPLAFLLLKGQLNVIVAWNNYLFWMADIFVYVVVPTVALFSMKKVYGIRPADYGLFRPFQRYLYGWKDFFIEVIYVTVSLFVVSMSVYYFAYYLWPEESVGSIYSDRIARSDSFNYFLMKFYLSITAGATEEIFYRGILNKIFSDFISKKGISDLVYVGVSSGLFTLAHIGYAIPDLVSVLSIGICASVLYLSIKRLEPLIIGHFLLDIVYL